jgi:hypothetical protein
MGERDQILADTEARLAGLREQYESDPSIPHGCDGRCSTRPRAADPAKRTGRARAHADSGSLRVRQRRPRGTGLRRARGGTSTPWRNFSTGIAMSSPPLENTGSRALHRRGNRDLIDFRSAVQRPRADSTPLERAGYSGCVGAIRARQGTGGGGRHGSGGVGLSRGSRPATTPRRSIYRPSPDGRPIASEDLDEVNRTALSW